MNNFASVLAGGDRRSLGRANEVAAMLADFPGRFAELMECLWSDDPLVRMRAADAAEKVTTSRPALLKPFKRELIGLAAESTQIEVRWHLALMLPRLMLSAAERKGVASLLKGYLNDRSSILRTLALQGLWDLSQTDVSLRAEVMEIADEISRTGTPAMKARARKLTKPDPQRL